jgi:hypothetical protein
LWTYRTATGAELGHVARFDDANEKDCVPFFHHVNGTWKSGAPPEPRPLFALDKIPKAAPAAPVYVTEGEKAAAALHSLGMAAVTSLGGYKAAAKSDWTPVAHAREIVILPDAGKPGEDYARDVTFALSALPGSREVKIARLPGLSEGQDVVDFLQVRVSKWDGFGPIPRELGDGLQVELLEAIEAHAEAPPVEWTQPLVEAHAEAWEAPVSLEAATIPSWPDDVFPAPIQRFAYALSESTETPRELADMTVLPTLAAAAQGTFRVRVAHDYFEPVCLWTCCASLSGTRKTAVWQAAVEPLMQWEHERRAEIEPEIKRVESQRKSIQARIDAKRIKGAKEKDPHAFDIAKQDIMDLEAAMPDLPCLPQIWAADVTPENLAVIMAENNECMALLSDEGGMLDILAGRYSNGVPNLDVYLQGHAGSPVRVNRGSRPPVFLQRPCLSMGIAPQPDVVKALQDKPGFRGRGLLARFLYAMPESNLGRRTLNVSPMPDDVRDAYADLVRTILDLPWNADAEGRRCAHVLKLSPEALDLWNVFARSVEAGLAEGGTFAHITDWAGKLPGAVVRIAAVLHVARHAHAEPWTHTIGTVDMSAAVRLGEVLSKHALITFDCMGADAALDDARSILSWIRREGLKEFTRRDCHKALQSRFSRADSLDAPLEILHERGFIRPKPAPITPGVGRPKSRMFDVNPLALERPAAHA